MPGQSKMVSTTTAPAIRPPNSRPIWVMAATTELRSTNFQISAPRREALRALVGDEVLLQRLEHAGAGEARDGGKAAERQRQRGQDQVAQRIGEDLEAPGEQAVDQQKAEYSAAARRGRG